MPFFKNIKGFTLIELASVLVIIGVLFAGLLALVKPVLYQVKLSATEANMNRIIDVLSVYAQRNSRLPCPANPDITVASEPYGAETGSGSAGAGVGDCDEPGAGERVEGIVPFKTLGMTLDDVRDGWGNMITYRVSPAFARNPAAGAGAHMRCRVDNVWVSGGANRQPAKARFCCPDTAVAAATDIAVRDGAGKPMWPLARDSKGLSYAPVDTAYTGAVAFDLADDNVTAIAFMLLSHGHNGVGAFLESGGRTSAGGIAGTGETENANNDNVFISLPHSLAESLQHFDDVIMWRTQDQIYAETGAGSCSFP